MDLRLKQTREGWNFHSSLKLRNWSVPTGHLSATSPETDLHTRNGSSERPLVPRDFPC